MFAHIWTTKDMDDTYINACVKEYSHDTSICNLIGPLPSKKKPRSKCISCIYAAPCMPKGKGGCSGQYRCDKLMSVHLCTSHANMALPRSKKQRGIGEFVLDLEDGRRIHAMDYVAKRACKYTLSTDPTNKKESPSHSPAPPLKRAKSI